MCEGNVYFSFAGFQEIYKFLYNEGVHSILLRFFNQDSLENLFGAMRALNFRNNNLTCDMFAASYKTLLLNYLMSVHSPGSNCEEDLSEGCLTPYKSLLMMYENNDTQNEESETVPKSIADGPDVIQKL